LLFQRDDWPPALCAAGITIRLLNRTAWGAGLTKEERAVLKRISQGERVKGIALDAKLATSALGWPHL
jgi:DNA-binding NarL/FixJ family response regulator